MVSPMSVPAMDKNSAEGHTAGLRFSRDPSRIRVCLAPLAAREHLGVRASVSLSDRIVDRMERAA